MPAPRPSECAVRSAVQSELCRFAKAFAKAKGRGRSCVVCFCRCASETSKRLDLVMPFKVSKRVGAE